MALSRTFFWMLSSLVVLVTISIITAFSAANTVSGSKADSLTSTINANALKPSACSALNLTVIKQCPPGGGTCTGTAASELILGSINIDAIAGKGGTDCILGGDGDDTINGNAGGDICIGGAGNDTFNKCETCTGGPGIDDFGNCANVTDRGPGE